LKSTAENARFLFMATTAEEAGLLGAKFYALRPLYPLEKNPGRPSTSTTVNPWGKTRDHRRPQ